MLIICLRHIVFGVKVDAMGSLVKLILEKNTFYGILEVKQKKFAYIKKIF